MATAEECSESTNTATTCIASSSSSSSIQQNWWNNLHADQGSLSSWNKVNTNIPIWPQTNPINNSTTSACINFYDEDVSMSSTNASNHSACLMSTIKSGRHPAVSTNNEFIIAEETSDNHIWNHVLMNVGSNGDLENQEQDVGDNFPEPACNDFLKKLDESSNWEEFTNNTTNFNSFNNQYHYEKKINGFTNHNLINHENNEIRLTKLSKLVNTLSISNPDQPEVNSHFINNPNLSIDDHYLKSSSFDEIGGNNIIKNSNNMFPNCSYYGPEDIKNFYGVPPTDSYNSRYSADLISFNSRLGKPFIDIHHHHHHGPKPSLKPLNFSCSKKQGISSSQTRISGRGQVIANEGKKKRIDQDPSETTAASKRLKQESCKDSSAKIQAPKVKLGDKITALQQIVSPFGKTDTASVLYEAIQHIKFLQEQIQMLSIPYIKANIYKDLWGSLERKDNGCEVKIDLRSRGLCLVPLSCAPQDYRDNTGSDYWTPVFRGRLYR